jgi:hypothetical protein
MVQIIIRERTKGAAKCRHVNNVAQSISHVNEHNEIQNCQCVKISSEQAHTSQMNAIT